MSLPLFESIPFWLAICIVVSGYAYIALSLCLSLLALLIPSAGAPSQKSCLPSRSNTHSLLVVNVTVPRTAASHSPLAPTVDAVVLGGLVTGATWIGGKSQNEDRFCFDDFGTAKLLIVADGVSSSQYGALAAEEVVTSLRRAVRAAVAAPNAVFDPAFFQGVCEQAAQRIAQRIAEGASADSTLVVLLELADRIVLAYLGDGGAIWVRGNQRGGRSLLLAQHDEHGRLSGYVGAQGVVGIPMVIQIQKSAGADGTIFVIGSDGALPRNQEIGRVHQLLQVLGRHLHQGDTNLTSADIAQVIERCLTSWNPDDNATLGILFTQEALTYWQQQLACSQEGEIHGDRNSARPVVVNGR